MGVFLGLPFLAAVDGGPNVMVFVVLANVMVENMRWENKLSGVGNLGHGNLTGTSLSRNPLPSHENSSRLPRNLSRRKWLKLAYMSLFQYRNISQVGILGNC